jgi:hypothetical protein
LRNIFIRDINNKLLKQTTNLRENPIKIFSQSQNTIKKVYSIYFKLDNKTKKTISNIQSNLRDIDKNHLYYQPNQLHMTIVGGFNKIKDFDLLKATPY